MALILWICRPCADPGRSLADLTLDPIDADIGMLHLLHCFPSFPCQDKRLETGRGVGAQLLFGWEYPAQRTLSAKGRGGLRGFFPKTESWKIRNWFFFRTLGLWKLMKSLNLGANFRLQRDREFLRILGFRPLL